MSKDIYRHCKIPLASMCINSKTDVDIKQYLLFMVIHACINIAVSVKSQHGGEHQL